MSSTDLHVATAIAIEETRASDEAACIQTLLSRIQAVLTPDLLRPRYRGATHPLAGHCYVAAEALYYLLPKDLGFRPRVARDAEGGTHWWLANHQGDRLDPTAAQYTDAGLEPPYGAGINVGFLTRSPSRRAHIVMGRVKADEAGWKAVAAISWIAYYRREEKPREVEPD